jgi:LmbE family N-acetylglucosaminyl deacetylase
VDDLGKRQKNVITFEPRFQSPAPRLLVLGAHADDIEIGCGGTLATLLLRYPDAMVSWVVFSGSGERQAEARRSAELYTASKSGADIRFESFRDGRFPFDAHHIKELFDAQLQPFQPDVIFTHSGTDRHQDHRVVSELTWQTFRNHTVLEYEIPKYDGDFGQPNVFATLEAGVLDTKVDRLMQCFASQASKHWFTPETFRGLARLRGVECAAESGYAEAFYARKIRVC